MDSQDHKIITASSSTGHGVHICHRCGWPFPNPHPSAKHRRAHKKVCGKVEGFTIIHSEQDDDHHVAVSDSTSDEDGRTPNSKLVKKNSDEFGSSGGVGEKSNKSEDDVFADAVTEFSDSGISPRVEKIIERKTVEGDLYNSPLLEVDDTRDKSEQLNDIPISDEIGNPGAQPNANDEPVSVIPSSDILVKEDKMASDPQTLLAVETKEEIFDKFASEVVEYNLSSQTEAPQNVDASVEVENVAETVSEIALAEEARENVNSFVGVETNEYSDVVSAVPCIDKKVEMADISECEMAGIENKKMGSNDKFSLVPEDDQTKRDLEKNSNNFEDKSNSTLSEAGNESSEGADVEAQLVLDSTMLCVNSTDLPTSCEERNLKEFSNTESILEKSVQEIDNGSKVTEDLAHVTSDDVRVESADVVAELEEKTLEYPISKSLSKIKDAAEDICINDGGEASESIDAAEVSTELNHETSAVKSTENSVGPVSKMQEALPVNEKFSNGTSPDVEEKHASENLSVSNSFGIVSSVVTSNNLSVTPSIEEPIHETCATGDNKAITNGDERVNALNSKSIQDDTPKQDEDDYAIDLSNSRCDSLEANCGSVSDALTKETHSVKSDVFEPPSFMTLVQSSEIETVHNTRHPKSDAQQAGWFPSITNVVNESQGRKKNEEIISRVTNWNPVKQHGPLKNLLNEVDSPNAKQERKFEYLSSKVNEEWNSPARYPIEIKKEKKKKGKAYWVPFVCCSSVHRDM